MAGNEPQPDHPEEAPQDQDQGADAPPSPAQTASEASPDQIAAVPATPAAAEASVQDETEAATPPASPVEATVEAAPEPEPAASEAATPPAPSVEATVEAAPEPPAEDMAALLDSQAGQTPTQAAKVGDRVSGVIVRVGDDNAFIDFGGRSEGIIRAEELKGEDGNLAFQPGEPLEAFVIGVTDSTVTLSRFVSGEARQADVLYKAFKAGVPIEGRVMAVNKWGLGVDLEGLRAFCPVSQIDTGFTEDPEQFRDRKMTFKIIRFRDRGRSIVLSRRALLEAVQEEEAVNVREHVVEGAELNGTVTRLENFGAFVDLGSRVEGLIHVSELRHERVNHPQDVVQPGQELKVKVLAVQNLGNRRKERISLSLKAFEKDPWAEVRDRFKAGSVVNGKIEAIEEYGAFVELAPNVRGLIHVSELAGRRVNHPRDVVSVGEEVKVAVLEVDDKRKRLRLSIRRAEQVEGETNLKEFAERQRQEKTESPGNATMLEALKRAQLIE